MSVLGPKMTGDFADITIDELRACYVDHETWPMYAAKLAQNLGYLESDWADGKLKILATRMTESHSRWSQKK